MKAMVLAAGFGTRLRPYSLLRPKPLFPVLNMPLLLQTVNSLHRCGFTPVLVNTHHLRQQIVDSFRDIPGVVLQLEEAILGTGGGLRLALPHFAQGPVLVTNGDIFHDIDPAWVYQQHMAGEHGRVLVTMVLHDCPRFNSVVVDADDHIVGFVPAGQDKSGVIGKKEELPAGHRRLAYTGIQVIDPAVLAMIPPDTNSCIIDCYRTVLRQGGIIRALVVKNPVWSDIGTPTDYLDLHRRLLAGDNAAHGRDSVLLADNVALGRSVVFQDWACIGAHSRIGDSASLCRVVVWDHAVVAPGAILTDTIVTS